MSDQTGARDILEEIRALNEERQAELAELLQPHFQAMVGRRELLQGGATLGLAGLLGGGAAYGAVGNARADASDSDSDGDIGEPGSPVDAWLDGISGDGSIIPIEDGLALDHASDTSATTSSGEQYFFGNTSAVGFTYTLASADLEAGHAKRIHCDGGNTLTVDTQAGAEIDGQSSIELEDGQQVTVYTDGTNWFTNRHFQSIVTGQIDIGSNVLAQSIVASGEVTLTSDTGVVDTGESATDATYRVALGVDDPNADVKLSATLFWDDSAGTYKVEITENVGGVNPTVNYDIIRTR